jgi:hypothetical protein
MGQIEEIDIQKDGTYDFWVRVDGEHSYVWFVIADFYISQFGLDKTTFKKLLKKYKGEEGSFANIYFHNKNDAIKFKELLESMLIMKKINS